jgi:prevent-host-death family protein
MAISGYDNDMSENTRTVTIAELRNRLSEYLRAVRAGDTVLVLNRDQPVARIVPPATASPSLEVLPRRPGSPPVGLLPRPSPLRLGRDVVDYLREERGER